MRRAGLLVAVAILRSHPAGAIDLGSGGSRLDVTSTTVGAYHTNNGNNLGCDDSYGDVFERLNLIGQHAPWSAGLRLDASVFQSTPRPGEGSPVCDRAELVDRYFNELIPEKAWLAYSGRRLEVVAGDSYVQFGRGLGLSLRKVDELAVDTSLRGGKALAHLGPIDGTLVAGVTNIGNVDEATGRHATDPNDLVAGGRVEVDVLGRVRPGAHAVLFGFHDRSNDLDSTDGDPYEERWVHVGPTLDAPRLLPNLGLYLEWLHQRRALVSGDTQTGNGAYGTVTAYAGPATILVEGKAYGDLEVVQPHLQAGPMDPGLPQEFKPVQYTTPPTVERVLQRIEHPQRDIKGGRAQLSWMFLPSLSAFMSYGIFFDEYLRVPADKIHDPYAGLDVRWNDARSSALISVGRRATDLGDSSDTIADLHADAKVTQVLTRSLSAEAHVQHLGRNVPGSEDFREGTISAGLRMAAWGGLAGILDYSTEPAAPREYSPGGVLDVDPTPSSTIRLFVGASRGGLRCINGVCRVFPPFEGVKLTATLRF